MNRRDWLKKLPLAAAGAMFPAAVTQPLPGKPRLRTAVCAYSFRDELAKGTMTYDDLIRLAADLGVDGLDLTVYWLPQNPTNEYLFSLRRLAFRYGIDIYSIGTRVQMCQPTPELREAETRRLAQWLSVAERLGARHMRVFGAAAPKGATEEQVVTWVSETLKQCAPIAGARGILLGLEDDGGVTDIAERLVQMVKGADSPWAGINLDLGNFKTDAYRQIETCLPYATNIHAKSAVHENNGQPMAPDWDRIFRMIAPVYRGYLSVEYEGAAPPRTAVPELVAKLQSMVRKYAPAG
ncbi:MAG: sugar phosphate isomerase/epimerase family protein [Candidatus Solibacter sp.]|jgi:sugar phosphate isomerase/epimerase